MFENLKQRGKIGNVELKNRIFKPAAQDYPCTDGNVNEALVRFCAEQAKGGAGLIITGLFNPNKHEGDRTGHATIEDDSRIFGLNTLAQAIHDNGAKASCQITHHGSHGEPRDESYGWRCVSRDGVENEFWFPVLFPEFAGKPYPHKEYTIDEIHELVDSYGNAAVRAKVAGFDMVEVHAGNMHGLNTWLTPLMNKRTDMYGGNLENRARILYEIVEDIQNKCGKGFPVTVRLNAEDLRPDGMVFDDAIEIAKKLEKMGVAAINITSLHGGGGMQLPMGEHLHYGEQLKKVLNIPVLVAGSMNTVELCENAIATGQTDYVGTARALYADPAWPKKVFENRADDITPCVRCLECMNMNRHSTKGNLSCSVNPRLGKELELPILPANIIRNVAVIGGGPAGLEAAMISAKRGHKVTLFEKRKLGGLVNEASEPPFKADLKRLIAYFDDQLKKLDVKIRYEEANADTLKDFDAAIVATGSQKAMLNVPGSQNQNVINGVDWLDKKTDLGQKIVVIGGGSVGVEISLTLGMLGKDVTIVEMQDYIMPEENMLVKSVYNFMIPANNINVLTKHSLKSIQNSSVAVKDGEGNEKMIEADHIIMAVGLKPDLSLRDELDKVPGLLVYYAGDCEKPKLIFDAIHAGFAAGMEV